MPVRMRSYQKAAFRLRVLVKVGEDADPEVVLSAVESSLGEAFSFDARSFGQMVSSDEVFAVAQHTPGVTAVQILDLSRAEAPPGPHGGAPRLFAALPVASPEGIPEAAELLVLSSELLTVESMP
jgi:hypothetical protein